MLKIGCRFCIKSGIEWPNIIVFLLFKILSKPHGLSNCPKLCKVVQYEVPAQYKQFMGCYVPVLQIMFAKLGRCLKQQFFHQKLCAGPFYYTFLNSTDMWLFKKVHEHLPLFRYRKNVWLINYMHFNICQMNGHLFQAVLFFIIFAK